MEVLRPQTVSIDAPTVIAAVLSGGVAEAVQRDPLFGEINPNYTSLLRQTTAMAIVGATLLSNAVEQGPYFVSQRQMLTPLEAIHTHVMLEKMHDAGLVVWGNRNGFASGFVSSLPSGTRLVQDAAPNALCVTPDVRGVYRSPDVRIVRKALAGVGIAGFGVKYGIEGLSHGDSLSGMLDTIALGTGVSAVAVGAIKHTVDLFGGMFAARHARQDFLRLSAQQ